MDGVTTVDITNVNLDEWVFDHVADAIPSLKAALRDAALLGVKAALNAAQEDSMMYLSVNRELNWEVHAWTFDVLLKRDLKGLLMDFKDCCDDPPVYAKFLRDIADAISPPKASQSG